LEHTGTRLGIHVELNTDFDTALQRVEAALKAEGFGVLTDIDVQETLRTKLGVEMRPYRILGACNPPLAHQALMAAPEVGLLLPCNVVVAQMESGGVDVGLIDPNVMMSVGGMSELEPIALAARERLTRVADALKE
jgi:uncharacterized protein (DUF302 family)